MGCDLPPHQCLEWHIKPHLVNPKRAEDGKGYRALCPAHDDRKHSFGISLADSSRQRLTWHCFAGCSRTRIRAVLIANGVRDGCLPLVTREREDLLVTLIFPAKLIFPGSSYFFADQPKGRRIKNITVRVRMPIEKPVFQ